jgi:hypothetical protein
MLAELKMFQCARCGHVKTQEVQRPSETDSIPHLINLIRPMLRPRILLGFIPAMPQRTIGLFSEIRKLTSEALCSRQAGTA